MDELAIRSPFEGLDLPLAIGDARLAELPRAPIRVIAPYRGREAAVSEALRAALGSGLPQIGRTVPLDGGRLIWAGAGQWMLTGPAAAAAVSALAGLAAVTDQSDGWAAMWLEGRDARAVLARLLRSISMPRPSPRAPQRAASCAMSPACWSPPGRAGRSASRAPSPGRRRRTSRTRCKASPAAGRWRPAGAANLHEPAGTGKRRGDALRACGTAPGPL
ncbi:MAG: hypothetical protein H6896_01935 [Rhodovulum sp.]|nr:hypothetical protein [Rhodovulum sp.]